MRYINVLLTYLRDKLSDILATERRRRRRRQSFNVKSDSVICM